MSASALTKNQTLVFDLLEQVEVPLTAYAILDRLRDDGLRSPPQVYRSLEHLIERGMVHRLETLNAFVACRTDGCAAHSHTVFMICSACKRVDEIADATLTNALRATAKRSQFALEKAVVELHGRCPTCAADAARAT
ncbi:MAG: Fur family transcriptional regulator [Pseudomonadota bacterium]